MDEPLLTAGALIEALQKVPADTLLMAEADYWDNKVPVYECKAGVTDKGVNWACIRIGSDEDWDDEDSDLD